ncbi:MAG: radical SAM protein [Candidatus Omnitrophota bacterium]|jgi:radical SAM superfamily enzyme YgiQ (UPF0313 family)
MSKIIFVNPPLTLKDRYGKFNLGGTVMPPLGLTNLAAMTREKGYHTKIIDGEIMRLDELSIAQAIAEERPDYVGITAVTLSIAKAAKIAGLIKSLVPSVKVIIGGPHITALPEKTFRIFKNFDIAVLGEGDITVCELLEALDRNSSLSDVKGIMFWRNNELVITQPRELIADLDKLPLPAWDLLPDLRRLYRPPINAFNRFPVGYLITSRGCYGRCIYCSRAVYKNKVRLHSAEYIVKMIKDLQNRFRVKEILFDDDEFLVNRQRIERLAELFNTHKIRISWSCLSRIKKLDPDLLRTLKKMGCWQISFGIESGDQGILDFLKKDTTLTQIESTLEAAQKSGIRTKGFFMIGHAIDTHESIKNTIRFAQKIALNDLQSSVFTPLPGSEIYGIARQYGTFDERWEKMNYWNIVFVPNGLTSEELLRYQKELFTKFYFRAHIIFFYMMMIRNPYQLASIFRAFTAFLKFIFSQRTKERTTELSYHEESITS